jgi:carboxymethylenebutenolidase
LTPARFAAGGITMRGYLARPAKATGKLPAILVVHENRGLNPHIEDITRRLALENFMAFAPDTLFPLGGYPGTEDEARALFPKLEPCPRRDRPARQHELPSVRGSAEGEQGDEARQNHLPGAQTPRS